jgi:hypothetical protein
MAASICFGEASPLTPARYSQIRMVSVGTIILPFRFVEDAGIDAKA